MSAHETETGFGTGLRAQIERLRGGEAEEAPIQATEAALPELSFEPFVGEVVPLVPEAPAVEPDEVAVVRAELEAALARERELR